MATWTNNNKSSDPTFAKLLRHGVDITVGDIADKTFEDTIFEDEKVIKDLTFNELVAQVWANENKNPATFANQTRNE